MAVCEVVMDIQNNHSPPEIICISDDEPQMDCEPSSENVPTTECEQTNTEQFTIIEKIFNLCRKIAVDDKDVIIVNKMSKKMSQCDTTYTNTPAFRRFAHSILKKIGAEPEKRHVFLKELYIEATAVKVRHRGPLKVEKMDAVKESANVPHLVPSCSVAVNGTQDHVSSNSGPSSITSEGDLDGEDKKLQMRVRRLEKLLRACDKKIKDLERRELSCDDMDDEESNYVLEDRYKRRCMQIFNKLCDLTGRSRKTGRSTEKKFTYNGSRYMEINTMIEKLVNRLRSQQEFPDFCDVLGVVNSCNDTHHLHLRPCTVDELARQVFQDIGKALKKRRIMDYREMLDCHLEDNVKAEYEAADVGLSKTFEEHKLVAQKKHEEILEQFVAQQHKEQTENPEGGNEENNDQEEEEEEDDDDEEEENDDDVKVKCYLVVSEDDDKDNDEGEMECKNLAPFVKQEIISLSGTASAAQQFPPDDLKCAPLQKLQEVNCKRPMFQTDNLSFRMGMSQSTVLPTKMHNSESDIDEDVIVLD